MPYAQDHIGIYKIVNTATGKCYVGQSQRVKKRVKEHFRLLNLGKHTNPRLQNAYNKYGPGSFEWTLEAECVDVSDLDKIEEAFLTGEALFEEPTAYNIADFAKAPMRGKTHTLETRKKIRVALSKAKRDFTDPFWKAKLSEGHKKRLLEDKQFVAKVRFIINNQDMSYAERGRILGSDTSSVRRLALKYLHLKGVL